MCVKKHDEHQALSFTQVQITVVEIAACAQGIYALLQCQNEGDAILLTSVVGDLCHKAQEQLDALELAMLKREKGGDA